MKNIIRGQKVSLNELGQNFELNINWNDINCKNYDIDSSLLIISDTGKMENEEDFIFYNNPKSKCSSINLKNSSTNSKKSFDINLSTLPNNVSRLIFVLTIDSEENLNHTFKNVKDIVLNFNQNNNTMIQYNVEPLDKETALILCELYKHNNEWKVQATGSGFNAGLTEIIKQYGSSKLQVENETKNNTSNDIKPITPPTNTNIASIQSNNTMINNNEIILAIDFSNNMSFKLKDGSIQSFIEKTFSINQNLKFDIFTSNEESYNHNILLENKNKERFIVSNLLNKYYLGKNLSSPSINKILSKHRNNKKVLYILYKEPEDFQNSLNLIKNSVNNGFIWNILCLDDNLERYKSNNINFHYIKDLYFLSESQIRNFL